MTQIYYKSKKNINVKIILAQNTWKIHKIRPKVWLKFINKKKKSVEEKLKKKYN